MRAQARGHPDRWVPVMSWAVGIGPISRSAWTSASVFAVGGWWCCTAGGPLAVMGGEVSGDLSFWRCAVFESGLISARAANAVGGPVWLAWRYRA